LYETDAFNLWLWRIASDWRAWNWKDGIGWKTGDLARIRHLGRDHASLQGHVGSRFATTPNDLEHRRHRVGEHALGVCGCRWWTRDSRWRGSIGSIDARNLTTSSSCTLMSPLEFAANLRFRRLIPPIPSPICSSIPPRIESCHSLMAPRLCVGIVSRRCANTTPTRSYGSSRHPYSSSIPRD